MNEEPGERRDSGDEANLLRAVSEGSEQQQYVLRLYVAGLTPRSAKAISRVKAICEEHLKGRCQLEIIDIYQKPTLARDEQIVAVPTLIKKLPLPLRRVIGDLQDKDALLFGLDLKVKGR
jgi:circadian clock protein KaiB